MIKHKGTFGTTLTFDPAGQLHTADVYTRSDGQPAFGTDGNTRIDLPGVVGQYPEARVIIIDSLTDEVAASVTKCTALETIVVDRVQITESGRHALQTVNTLIRICLRSGVEYSPGDVPMLIESAAE